MTSGLWATQFLRCCPSSHECSFLNANSIICRHERVFSDLATVSSFGWYIKPEQVDEMMSSRLIADRVAGVKYAKTVWMYAQFVREREGCRINGLK